ncbi:MAG: hypothetical protein GX459_08490 [Bacteroidales bacterium]|nr:hypothetical protein [Bacteroidales bacterium]
MNWIDINKQKPPMNTPILVITREFGFEPSIVIARMWQSSIPDQPMQFYLDRETYHINEPRCIAEQVIAWQYIPEVRKRGKEYTKNYSGGLNENKKTAKTV